MSLHSIRIAFLYLVAATSLNAQDKVLPFERGPSREPVPFVFDRESLKKIPAEFLTDYPAAYIHASTAYRIEADGTVEATTHEVIRLNNRKGIDKVGEHRNISFVPAHEKLVVNEARVIKTDGSFFAVEPRGFQLRDVPTDYQVYDASKELIISFPALEVGDIVEVKWTTRGRNLEYDGQFFNRYSFGDMNYPVWKEVFSIRTTPAKPIKYALVNPALLRDPAMKPETTEDKYGVLHIWRDSKLLPIAHEEDMPEVDELRPGVAFTTYKSWEEVGAWERKIRKECEECTQAMKVVVERITRDHKTPEAIARELTRWVRTNIRYVSAGDKHDFTPHPPSLVFKNRCGDCKDGAQLLAIMLRQAGLPSGFVSLSPKGDGQILDDVPCPWSTHAILYVSIDGKDRWIDTTASYAGWDYLPYSDRDRVAYVVDDTSIRLMKTPPFSPADNRTLTATKIKFDKKGNAHCTTTVEYYGEAALAKREQWIDASAKVRRRLIRKSLLDEHSRVILAETIDVDLKSLMDFDGPVKVTYAYELPEKLAGAEGTFSGSVTDAVLYSKLISVNIDDERDWPIKLSEPFERQHRFELDAPKGYEFGDLPDDEEIESKWGTHTLKVKEEKNGSRWVIESNTRIGQTRVRTAEFDRFREFQNSVSQASGVTFLLTKPADN